MDERQTISEVQMNTMLKTERVEKTMPARLAAILACIGLFAAAPLFLMFTWQESYQFSLIRHLSIPVMAVQFLIVSLAIASGSQLPFYWRALKTNVKIAWLVFGLCASLATILANAIPQFAIAGFISTLLHAIFLAVCCERFGKAWQFARRGVLWALGLGCVFYFLLLLALLFGQRANPDFNWVQVSGGVSNVRQLAFYGLTAAGIGAGFFAKAGSRKEAFASFMVLTIGVCCVFASGGRAAAGGLIGMLVLIAILITDRSQIVFIVQMLGSLFIAAIASLALAPSPQWGIMAILSRLDPNDPTRSDFTSGRIEMWLETGRAVLEQPFVGYGQLQYRTSLESSAGHWNHPHNSILQFLFDWGIIGTAALAFLAWVALKKILAALNNEPVLALPAIGAFTSLAIMSLAEGAFYHVFPSMVCLVCLSILLSAPSNVKPAAL